MSKKPTYEELEKRVQELEQKNSEHKRKEEQLIHFQDLMDYIISHANSAIAVHDKDLNYIYVSKQYFEEYKVKEQNVIGKHHYEVFPDLPQKWRDVHQRSLAGEVLSAEEDPYYREDGSVDLTRWECRPWYESDGSIGGIIIYTEVINERMRAEEALRESEERYSLLTQNSQTGIYIHIDGVLKFVNNYFAEMLNDEPENMIGRLYWDFVHPGDREMVREISLARAKGEKAPLEYEFRHQSKDGKTIWVHNLPTIIQYQGQTANMGNLIQINDRKQAEKALQESESKYRLLFENLLHEVHIWELVRDEYGNIKTWKLVDANPVALKSWNRTLSEVIDKTPDEMFPDSGATEQFMPIVEKIFTEGTPHIWESHFPVTNQILHMVSIPLGEYFISTGLDITERKQTEEERRKSDERFRIAQEMSPDGFTILRPVRDDQDRVIDFTWIYENEAAARMNGTDPQKVVGQRLLELFPGHQGTQFFNAYKQVAEAGKPITFEEEYVGETIKKKTWFRIVVVPMTDNIAILNHDITERKRAEENLKSTFDISPSIISKANIDTGYFTEMSPVATKILGFTVEELTSRPFMEFVHPDDRQRTIKEVSEQLQGKEVASFENRYLCKDGSYKWIAWEGTSADKNGIVTAIGSNINERKQAEEKLLESETKYRHLYETMSQGVVIQDAEGSIIEANHAACEILGLSMDQMLGKTAYNPRWKLIHEDGSPYDPAEMPSNIALLTGKPSKSVHCGIYVPEKDEYRWIVIGSVPRFKDGKTKPFFTLTVFTDITGLKNLETKLLQAQKLEAIGNLAGGIAHDFNNILSSIIGFTELSLDDVEKGTHIEDNLQEVYAAGKRAKDLVKQILAFARQSDEKRKPIQVDLIVNEVLQFIRSSIPTTIEIKQNIESESLIMGNSTQVHQILMNLGTNAANAMEDEGGILEVSLKDITVDRSTTWEPLDLKLGDYIEIKVSDTGTGIQPEILKHIFEPYFTTKAPGEGTGMGLAMVHGIVDSYGGKIMVDSIMGKGTIFTIYLPITRKRGDHRAYESEELPSGAERILFVDDEAPIAKMGGQVLERLGYKVTTRTSSVEALELFRSKPNDFDLIVTDMTMPNITGDILAIELMKIRQDIPVILCTGYSKKLSDENAAEFGIKAFAYKPIVKSHLAKTVRKVLDEAKGPAHA